MAATAASIGRDSDLPALGASGGTRPTGCVRDHGRALRRARPGGQRNPHLRAATDDVFPFLLYTSQDAQVTIGLTDGGHAVVVRDGHLRRIPWRLSIAIPFDSNAPGTAW
jgi:hypothetical protein